jgi:hypothetical protein
MRTWYQALERFGLRDSLAIDTANESTTRLCLLHFEQEALEKIDEKLGVIVDSAVMSEYVELFPVNRGRLKQIRSLATKLRVLIDEEKSWLGLAEVNFDLKEKALDILHRLERIWIYPAPRGRRGAGPSRLAFARDLAGLWNEYRPEEPAGAYSSPQHGWRPNRGGRFVLDILHTFRSPDQPPESPRWLARALSSPK